MKVDILYEDGNLKMSMGAKNVQEMEQLIHQFMDPIAHGLGYEIMLRKMDNEKGNAAHNGKFREL